MASGADASSALIYAGYVFNVRNSADVVRIEVL